MNPTFAQNARIGAQPNAIWRATLELSMRGCEIVKFTSGERMPSLELSQPLDGIPVQRAHHGDRVFESGEFMGCRVYWRVPEVPS